MSESNKPDFEYIAKEYTHEENWRVLKTEFEHIYNVGRDAGIEESAVTAGEVWAASREPDTLIETYKIASIIRDLKRKI